MNKIVGITLSALFALFAILQLNDVDPWLWVALYLFVAAVIGGAALGYYRSWAAWLGIGICVVWMLSILPEFINWISMGMPTITGKMKATEPHIEFTREFLGLGLAAAALGYTIWQMRKKSLVTAA